jgi:methyl-accepting chemotaxis protein
MADAKPRRRFRNRLASAVVALTLVPLGLLGVIVVPQYQRTLTDQVNAVLAADAESAQQLVEAAIGERRKNVESWSEDAIIRGGLLYNTYDKVDTVLRVLQERYPQFSALVLFTPDGRAVSANTAELRDSYVAQQSAIQQSSWFQAALVDKITTDGIERVDPLLGEQVMHFAQSIESPVDGKQIGVLMAAFDFTNGVAERVDPAVVRAVASGYSSFEVIVARDSGTVLFDSRARVGATQPETVKKMIAVAGKQQIADIDDQVAVIARGGQEASWVYLAVVDKSEAYAAVRRSLLLMIALMLVFGGTGVLLSMWMASRMVRPITTLSSVVGRIVTEGDLTQKIEIESNDEIGELATTFARMVERLREIPATLKESTRMLAESVENLGSSTSEQQESINRQAAALQEAQVTVQEIKQTSLLAAQKAEAVLRVAERADEISRAGETAIEQSLGGLTDIREQVAQIAEHITSLTERTRQIGMITETVKDLADQSNMLALNAAIEAVRSGEHGKGFSVVAREIRSLADQSIQATNRVREILDAVSAAIRAAVSITEKGAEKMESGLVQVRSSGENLRELSTIVRDNSAAVRQIAAAVSQQNAGISQISSAVQDLNQMMSATVSRLEVTAEAGNTLKTVSNRVSQIVGSYRV